MEEVRQGFKNKQGLVRSCGAIDGTHFKMELGVNEQSWENRGRYKEFKMVMQTIVGPNKFFLDIVTGCPDARNDTRILYNSSSYHLANTGHRLQGQNVVAKGQPMREYIFGDSVYPLLPWSIRPFPDKRLVDTMDSFNFKHSSTQMVVKQAFGALKKVWRILGRNVWRDNVKYFIDISYACMYIAVRHSDRLWWRNQPYLACCQVEIPSVVVATPPDDDPYDPGSLEGHRIWVILMNMLWRMSSLTNLSCK